VGLLGHWLLLLLLPLLLQFFLHQLQYFLF
jgi:hypothetical protein